MYATNWIGMGVVMVGLAMVGLSTVLSEVDSSDTDTSHGTFEAFLLYTYLHGLILMSALF